MLLERSQSLVSDNHDRQLEDAHIEQAPQSCGYPNWTFLIDQMMMKAMKRKQKWFRKPAPYCVSLCGRHIGKAGPGDEETSGACHNETS